MWGKSTQSRILLAAATSVALFGGLTLVPPAEAATTTTGKALLNNLTVKPETPVGYARTKFKLWVDADHDSCDTREEILVAESRLPAVTGTSCKVISGQWLSWYDGKTWTNPLDVDIDHIVPLKEAWDSGAKTWAADKRQAYANDLGYAWSLDAVTDNVNQSKGDRDPADWLPDLQQCRYAIHWVAIKTRWGLAIDQAEKTELSSLLSGNCGARKVKTPALGTVPPLPSP
jgi:hypothetical protein